MSNTQRVQYFGKMDSKAYQLGPLKLAFKRSDGADEGEGSYSVIESLEQPGANVALHRHPAWQETFIVLEGRFDFQAAGEHHSLGPGEMLVIPRGAPHGFACTSSEAGRLLTISSPARVFEAFVLDTSAANSDPAVDVRAVFEHHGLELL
ncbi:MAG TPA: cupin domain-containing protein [Polyangiaceae bacterium]|nr:cupin domain-containing protein [Polyangiaceae bacterium]